jgi:hypothetical protein
LLERRFASSFGNLAAAHQAPTKIGPILPHHGKLASAEQIGLSRVYLTWWLACHTQEEIAEREQIAKATVSEVCSEMDLPEANKPATIKIMSGS